MQKQLAETENWEEIDLREYINVLLKWKWMIILFTIASILTAFIVSKYFITPVYETKAVLMATQPDVQRVYRDDGGLESAVNSFSRLPELTLNSLVSQGKNAKILGNVIQKLGLEEKEYDVKKIEEMLHVSGNPDNNLLEIKVSNTDPLLATLIANTFIEELYTFLSNNNQKQMKESVNFLRVQLSQTEEELKEVTEKYQKYQAQTRNFGILTKDLESKASDLSKYKSLLLQNQVELEQLIAGKARIEESLEKTPVKLVTKKTWEEQSITSNVVENILPVDKPENTMVSEEINPAYLELMKMLDTKNTEVAEKQARIMGITEVVGKLENQIANLQIEVSEKQLEESRLKRKVDSLEKAYVLLNEKIIETEISKSVDLGKTSLSIVSPAFEPSSPVKPNKTLNMVIAMVLGLMISVFVAFVLEFFDDTVKIQDDLKKYLDVPVLATIPSSNE